MPRPRVLPYLITGMLTKKEAISGKEILNEFKYEIGEFWKVSHTQLYPELNRMCEDNLIRKISRSEDSSNKVIDYQLTSEGYDFFYSWIKEPISEKNEQYSILKIYFLEEHDKKIIQNILSDTYQIHEKKRNKLLKRQTFLSKKVEDKAKDYGHFIILSRAIDRETHHLNWIKNFLQDDSITLS